MGLMSAVAGRRPRGTTAALAAAGYVACLLLAELLVAASGFVAGGVAHLALAIGLCLHASGTASRTERAVLVSLLVVPLVRLASLTVLVAGIPAGAAYLLVGVPGCLALLLAMRAGGTTIHALLQYPADPALQGVIAASGVFHGLIASVLLDSTLLEAGSGTWVVVDALVLVAFGAVFEELLFRGLLQSAMYDATGSRAGAISVSSIAYASMFVSASSPWTPMFMLALGVVFGVLVAWTRSLWGVLAARAIMLIGAGLVWPVLLR